MIRIVAVNAKNERIAALLRYLQLSTLQGDKPYDVRDGYWWIAYDGAMPVAFCGLTFWGMAHPSKQTDAGYLCRSGVLHSHRGRNIQKRMLRVRERKARGLGWNWLVSDTFNNPASSNSLIACGFRLFIPAYRWGLPGALYWRKKIAQGT